MRNQVEEQAGLVKGASAIKVSSKPPGQVFK